MSNRKRAAIYCRISLDKRIGTKREAEGVERQERVCRDLCRRQEYEVVDVFIDNSISAHGTATKQSKERPEYNKMIEGYKEGKYDVIVAYKLDRISRNNVEINSLIRELKGHTVFICTTDVPEQSLQSATAQLLLQISTSVSQWESSIKSERQKTAYRDNAMKGYMRKNPIRCYGYTHDNEIIPEEAEIVRLIYSLVDQEIPASANAITRALRGEDEPTLPKLPLAIPTRVADAIAKGKTPPDLKWSSRATRNILRNPKYAGYVYHAPTKDDGGHQSYASNWREWIVCKDNQTVASYENRDKIVHGKNFDPIVPEDVWWRVQSILDENLYASGDRLIKRNPTRKSIGSGIYICSTCGRPVKSGGRANFKGHDYGMTYYCKGHVSRIASHIDEYVFKAVKKRLAKPDLENMLFVPDNSSERIEEIRNEIRTLDMRIAQTESDYDEDLIDAKTRKRKITKLEEEINELIDERTSLQTPDAVANIINAPDPVAAFEELTDPRQIGQIIDMLCTVTVYPHQRGKRITAESLMEEVKIEWKTA